MKPTWFSGGLDIKCEEENQRWPQGFWPEQLEVANNWDREDWEGNVLGSGEVRISGTQFWTCKSWDYISCSNRDVESVVAYMSLEFRTSDINLDVLRILMVFKALKVEVINVYREVWKWSAAILHLSVTRSGSWGGTSKRKWEGTISEVRWKPGA